MFISAIPQDKVIILLLISKNEINSIPFFDVQLPREIAIVIFGFLDMHDLCTCSLVSYNLSCLVHMLVLCCYM